MTAGLGRTWWQYLLLFLAVAASQRKLDLAAVIVVAVIAGEAGGLGDLAIGRRWGRRLLVPGRCTGSRPRYLHLCSARGRLRALRR